MIGEWPWIDIHTIGGTYPFIGRITNAEGNFYGHMSIIYYSINVLFIKFKKAVIKSRKWLAAPYRWSALFTTKIGIWNLNTAPPYSFLLKIGWTSNNILGTTSDPVVDEARQVILLADHDNSYYISYICKTCTTNDPMICNTAPSN